MNQPNTEKHRFDTASQHSVNESKTSQSQPLYQMVYVSTIRYSTLFDDHFFNRLGYSALKNNQKRNITGVLCFGNGYFLQYTEGSEQELTNLKNILLQDKRHYNMQLFDFSRIEHRRFPNYPRGFVVIDKKNQMFTEIQEFVPFNPLILTLNKQMELVNRIQEYEMMKEEFYLSRVDIFRLRFRLSVQLFRNSFTKQFLIIVLELILLMLLFIGLPLIIFSV